MRLALLLALLALASTPLTAQSLGVVLHLPYGKVGGYRPVLLVYAGTDSIQAFHVTIEPVLRAECSRGSLEAPKLPILDLYVPAFTARLPAGVRLPAPPGTRVALGLLPGLPTFAEHIVNESLDCNVSLGYRVSVEPYPAMLALQDVFVVEGGSEKLPPLLLAYAETLLESGFAVPAGRSVAVTIVALSVASDPQPVLTVESPSGVSRVEPRWDPGYRGVVEAVRSWWSRVSGRLAESLGLEPPEFHSTIYVGRAEVSGGVGEYILYYASWRGARSNPGILYTYNPNATLRVVVVDEGVGAYLLLLSHQWVREHLGSTIASLLAEWLGLPRETIRRVALLEKAVAALNTTGLLFRPSWEKLGIYARLWVVEPSVRVCNLLHRVKPDVVVLGFNLLPLPKSLSEIRCPDGSTLLDALTRVVSENKGRIIVSMGSLGGYEIGVCRAETGSITWITYSQDTLNNAEDLGMVMLWLAERVKRRLASSLCSRANLYLEEGRLLDARRLEKLATLIASAPVAPYTIYNGLLAFNETGGVETAPSTLLGWQLERLAPLNASRDAVDAAARMAEALAEAYSLASGQPGSVNATLAAEAAAYSVEQLLPSLIEAFATARVGAAERELLVTLYGETIRLNLDAIIDRLSGVTVRLLAVSRDARAAVLCFGLEKGYTVLLSTVPLGSLKDPKAWITLLNATCGAEYGRLYSIRLPRSILASLEKRLYFYTSSGYTLTTINATILSSRATLDLEPIAPSIVLLLHPYPGIEAYIRGNATILAEAPGYTLIGVADNNTVLSVSCASCTRLLNPLYVLVYKPLRVQTVTLRETLTVTETRVETVTVVETLRETVTETSVKTTTIYKVLTPATRTVTVTAPPETLTVTSYATKTLTVTITGAATGPRGGVEAVWLAVGIAAGATLGFIASRALRGG